MGRLEARLELCKPFRSGLAASAGVDGVDGAGADRIGRQRGGDDVEIARIAGDAGQAQRGPPGRSGGRVMARI